MTFVYIFFGSLAVVAVGMTARYFAVRFGMSSTGTRLNHR
jgi:hypothetical protein